MAALFGFGGIAVMRLWIGQILVFILLILAVLSTVLGRNRSTSI